MHSLASSARVTPASSAGALAAFDDPGEGGYCPLALLASFAWLMAGHGRCVHIAMMLGDGEYAGWQLACARGLEGAELAAVTARLAAYFDDPQATPVMGTA